MARTWLSIRVDLLEGRGEPVEPSPGRVFIVGPSHSFEQLATAIDLAFARWDISHLHLFELADGRRFGFPDDDELVLGTTWLDHAAHKVAREVKPGEQFAYVFDLGDGWLHRCTVLDEKFDPAEEYGGAPRAPTPIDGWGAMPDQYGRRSYDEEDDEPLG